MFEAILDKVQNKDPVRSIRDSIPKNRRTEMKGINFAKYMDNRSSVPKQKIRVQYIKPKSISTMYKDRGDKLEQREFNATKEGIRDARLYVRELMDKYKKNLPFFETLREGQQKAIEQKVQVRNEGADEVLKEIKKLSKDKKYKTPQQIEKVLFKKMDKPKYTTGTKSGELFFDKQGKNFSFPRDKEFFGVPFAKKKGNERRSALRQIIGTEMFKNNPNYKNASVLLTKFYSQDPKKPTFKPSPNEEKIMLNFLRKFSFIQAFGKGKGQSIPEAFFRSLKLNVGNKIKTYDEVVGTEKILRNYLSNPNLPNDEKLFYQQTLSKIVNNKNTLLKGLKDEIPNLFSGKAKAGYMQLDHRVPKALGARTTFLPYDYIGRATYVPGRFNQIKSFTYDVPLIKAIEGYNNGTPEEKLLYKKEIQNLNKDFNSRTKGYIKNLKFKFDDEVQISDKTKPISKVDQREVLKEIDKNIKHSNAYFNSYKNQNITGIGKGVKPEDYIIKGKDYDQFKSYIKTFDKDKSLLKKAGPVAALAIPAYIGSEFLPKIMFPTEYEETAGIGAPIVEKAPSTAQKIAGATAATGATIGAAKTGLGKKALKVGGRFIAPAFVGMSIYDTGKALQQGKGVVQSLEEGILGTGLTSAINQYRALSPEGKEAFKTISQAKASEDVLYGDFARPVTQQELEKAQGIYNIEARKSSAENSARATTTCTKNKRTRFGSFRGYLWTVDHF